MTLNKIQTNVSLLSKGENNDIASKIYDEQAKMRKLNEFKVVVLFLIV